MAELNEALYRTVVESFEGFCRMIPQAHLSPEQKKVPWETAVEVLFKGPRRGGLRMDLYGNLAGEIAFQMTGSAMPKPEEVDALGEMANIVCGNILPFAFGSEAILDLDRPKRLDQDRPVPGNVLSETEIPLSGGRLKVRLWADVAA